MGAADPARRGLRGPLACAVGVALAAAGAGTFADSVEEALSSFAAAAGQGTPRVRIGLESGPRILVSSRAAYRIVDPASGADVWRSGYEGEIAVVAEGAPENEIPPVYRVQVGAYSTRETAESEKASFESRYAVPGVVHYVPDRGTWRVRLGSGANRDALSDLVDRLRADGLQGIWIAEEPAAEVSGVTLRLVDTRTYESEATGLRRLAVLPGSRAVRVEGKPYRGILELRVSPFGRVRPVNRVELEQYLRGVVPAELGPEVWPRLEALKAQAVAARTYVVRNLGQFEEEGFDLCDSPRCQVYKGIDAEHPLSDRAIRATASEVLVWEGRPINAMFTATCGGHTEDAANVFAEERAPYLTGVPCREPSSSAERSRVVLAGREPELVLDEARRDRSRAWALLRAAGVLGEADSAASMTKPLTDRVARRWIAALAARAGLAAPPDERRRLGTVAEACSYLVDSLGWRERVDVLLDDADVPGILRDDLDEAVPRDALRAAAYLATIGAVERQPDGDLGLEDRPVRSRFLPLLEFAAVAYEVDGLRTATFLGIEGELLHLFRGKSEIRVPRSPDLRLLDGSGHGAGTPVGRIVLYPGDRIRYRTDPAGRVDYLEIVPPVRGTSDDRIATLYSWTERISGPEIEAAIDRRVDIGTLRDLRVLRRGVSGRIAELEVIGDRGREVVRGFDVRRLLGIRESLAVLEIQRGRDGRIESVLFSGKGWGHGVGLCQVGAYGMALRGRDYREILGHYYRGTTLARVDARGRVADAASGGR